MKPIATDPNHRILLIDDNPAIHEDFRKIFADDSPGQAGLSSDEEVLFDEPPAEFTCFQIQSAYQGEEGLAFVQRSMASGEPFALAFVDVRMPPGWDGVETIARLWEVDANLQVVICTAYSDYSWGDIRRRLGNSDNLLILKKPFDNIEVLQLAHALTRKWQLNIQASVKTEQLEEMVSRRTDELQNAQEAFRVMFDASPIGISLKNADGRYIAMNDAAVTLFGRDKDAIIGRTPVELGWVDSETMHALERKVASFGGLDAEEIAYSNPVTGTRSALLWLRAVTFRHAPHVLGFYLDITDRSQMEKELRRARIAAEGATKAKSEFLANMSHEIRTPLNGVLGLTAILEDAHLPEDTRSTIRLIRASGETLAKILDDVLDFSKIECGKLDLEEAPFSLRESLEWSVDLFRPKADEKHLLVDLTIDRAIPERLVGDATRIRQVLANLISNATKFTEMGSIRISADLTKPGGPGHNCQVRIRVADTGIGIPSEKVERLFRSFTQVDTSTTRRFGGSGLGLVICKRLVELMGGGIRLESQPGTGSTFEFDFMASIPAIDELPLLPAPEVKLKHLRILVAEDNPVNQVVTGSMLRRLGCMADFVANGQEALHRVGESEYDLVLMDVQMPEIDGIEATRLIRTMPSPCSQVPIIAVTASASGSDRAECLAAGMSDYLTKPLRLDALRQALERWTPAVSGTTPDLQQVVM